MSIQRQVPYRRLEVPFLARDDLADTRNLHAPSMDHPDHIMDLRPSSRRILESLLPRHDSQCGTVALVDALLRDAPENRLHHRRQCSGDEIPQRQSIPRTVEGHHIFVPSDQSWESKR
eukprot:CAMPEP_0198111194 /NCGR_PEP_ID=MMETSP1442-20131203/3180_1 /TAXON_ID= /ORGANISM="Craspedostauros australis, Strain CCMP3328" /LENGTH=117 /DNA_ID=CAMNT_0043767547 /DNA_START=117 /DNA_END=470 /DNA_ORIENTATION=-